MACAAEDVRAASWDILGLGEVSGEGNEIACLGTCNAIVDFECVAGGREVLMLYMLVAVV
ncbi:hypothetical protein BGAL_0042g00120 [Botrytis galanthina]|uniref:Uncharacterized protein n=1 Tax=Botrytis galanthina TaxID=278940 RepID=A0A4V4HVL7_9HELO|nr:hypothetical protein BGAL_0042g00120 [Botrytis galanthina]